MFSIAWRASVIRLDAQRLLKIFARAIDHSPRVINAAQIEIRIVARLVARRLDGLLEPRNCFVQPPERN
jgi:hypothetical protein